jgi:hypothetical protein
MPAQGEKVFENLLRRVAKRQGLELHKTRRRDPRALDYGTWTLIDAKSGTTVNGELRSLEEVDQALSRPRRR